jgi:Tfp pilus assembly pilus retraction ATPase PilT
MAEKDFSGWGFKRPRIQTEDHEEEVVKEAQSAKESKVSKFSDEEEQQGERPKAFGGIKKKKKEEELVDEPKFQPQVSAASTIADSDLPLWWKALMEFVAEKRVTDILFSPENYEVYCRINTKLELYQCVGKENYDRLIYNRMTQDRESTGGKHDLIVAKKSEELIQKGETDFAITTFGRRMRVNVFKSLKGTCAAFRPLPNKSIPWRENGLTEAVIKVLDNTKQGLVLVTGPTGSGKCLGPGTEVLMFDGNVKKVEEIKVGDLLMGPDSKPKAVLKTTAGVGPLYKINPIKGKPWVCNDEHILTLRRTTRSVKYKQNGSLRNEGEYQAFGKQFRGGPNKKRTESIQKTVDVKLKDFIKRTSSKRLDHNWKLFRTGVNFPVSNVIMDIDKTHFYYLGLWLGDGAKNANRISTADEEIVEWVSSYCKKHNFNFRNKVYSQRPNIHLIGASQKIERAVKRNEKFPFIIGQNQNRFDLKAFLGNCLTKKDCKKLHSLKEGIGEKRIPRWAITSTRAQRLSLLAGLLDSDGHLKSNCFDFVNKGKEFVGAVAFLSRSIGLWSSEPKEKIVNGTPYYRITISGDVAEIPTVIARKKGTARKQIKDHLVTGWNAEPIDNGQYFGFELDGDGRFLLGDFTVTHNSTTICSMIEYINEKYPYHIITIEDPIEYIFTNKKCVVDQREVEEHTHSFQSALRASLRENPDIIFVGELRDYETARTALMAADTGHLVFATLHTRRVYSTISRLLEMAPENSRSEMRAMISNALSMVMCQRLLQKKGGGIYPCREVMMLNPAISALIKEGKEKGISSQLTINQSRGMLEWGRALELAQEAGLITKEESEKYRDSTEDID